MGCTLCIVRAMCILLPSLLSDSSSLDQLSLLSMVSLLRLSILPRFHIIPLLGPQEESIGQIREFQKLFLAPGFLAYGGTLISISLVNAFYFAPK